MARSSYSSSSSYGLYGGPAEQPISNRFVPIPFEELAAAATIKQQRYDQSVDSMNKLVGGLEGIVAGSPVDENIKQEKVGELNNLIEQKYGIGVDLGDRYIMQQFNKDASKFRSDPELRAIEYNSQASSILRNKLAEARRVHGDNEHRYADLLDLEELYRTKGSRGLLDETGSMYMPSEFNVPAPVDRFKETVAYLASANPSVWEKTSQDGVFVVKKGQEKLAAEDMLGMVGIDLNRIKPAIEDPNYDPGDFAVILAHSMNSINIDNSPYLTTRPGQDLKGQAFREYHKSGNKQFGMTPNELKFIFETPENYLKYRMFSETYPLAMGLAYQKDIDSRLINPTMWKAMLDAKAPTAPIEVGVGSYDIVQPREKSSQKMLAAYGKEAAEYGTVMSYIANRLPDPGTLSKEEYMKKFDKEAYKLSDIYKGSAAASAAGYLVRGRALNLPGLAASTLIVGTGTHLVAEDMIRDGMKKMGEAMYDLQKGLDPESKDLDQMMAKIKKDNPNWDKMSVMERRDAFLAEESNFWDQFHKASVIRQDYSHMTWKEAEEAQNRLAQKIFSHTSGADKGKLEYKAGADGHIKGQVLVGQGMITTDDKHVQPSEVIKKGDIVSYEGRTSDTFAHGAGYHVLRISPEKSSGGGLFSSGRKSEVVFVRGSADDVLRQLPAWTLMEPYRTPTKKMQSPMELKVGSDTYRLESYLNHLTGNGEYTLEYVKIDPVTKKEIGSKTVLKDSSGAPNGIRMFGESINQKLTQED